MRQQTRLWSCSFEGICPIIISEQKHFSSHLICCWLITQIATEQLESRFSKVLRYRFYPQNRKCWWDSLKPSLTNFSNLISCQVPEATERESHSKIQCAITDDIKPVSCPGERRPEAASFIVLSTRIHGCNKQDYVVALTALTVYQVTRGLRTTHPSALQSCYSKGICVQTKSKPYTH